MPIIFSYNFVLILSGLKYSAGLVPFIVHPVINTNIYMHVYNFYRIFHFRNFSQTHLRDRVVAHPINYSRESRIFAYRVSLICTRSINNIAYIKIYEYVRLYIFLGSFAQPKCDGFLEWKNRFLCHTQERNGHKKVRAKFLARQLQSCLDLRTRNKN